MAAEELVLLVDESNTLTGTCPKATVHGPDTPLHRGFSVFVFDTTGRMLIQQRNLAKKTWPGIWSNACCGHPRPGETSEEAARRRLMEELTLQPAALYEVLPNYRYKAEFNGVVENEFCPVWVCWSTEQPVPNPAEVADLRWISWKEFLTEIRQPAPHAFSHFSPWCKEEAALLDQSAFFHEIWHRHTQGQDA